MEYVGRVKLREAFKSDPSDLIGSPESWAWLCKYRAVEDCWPPPTPPSPALLCQDAEDEAEVDILHLNLILEL